MCTSRATGRYSGAHISSTAARRFAYVAFALALSACPVDERQLELGTGGTGGAGGAAARGGSKATGSAGEGGEGLSGGLVDGCADLDTDGVADCVETIVDNASFADDTSGWTPLGGARLVWDPKNALTEGPSGSAKLSDDTPRAAAPRASAAQCVPIDGERLVIAYANAFVEQTIDSDDFARAELEVSFFRGEDCSGASDGFFETPPSNATGAWTVVQAGGLSKETTRSASIALIGIKAESAAELDVYFDNVMIKANDL